MTEFPFCPVYRSACELKPWKNSKSAHTGLLFDKFADAWGPDPELKAMVAFDKGRSKKEKGTWLKTFRERFTYPKELLDEVCLRQCELVESLGGKVLCFKNTSRFVTGMGLEHPLENGFTWHHTLGVPYLPGTSVKGLLRAWLREENFEKTGDWMGTPNQVGKLILLDLLPRTPPQLAVDVMTPHYGPYYQEGEIPGDWHDPVPITFLVVERDTCWQLGVIPTPGFPQEVADAKSKKRPQISEEDLKELSDVLPEAMAVFGAGAKTAVGYGRFDRDPTVEDLIQQEAERRKKEREEKAAREIKLAGFSPALRQLVELTEAEHWETNQTRFLDGVKRYIEQNPSPASDCVDWIRDNYLEKFWPGIWNNPDAKKGKKKDKPKYSEHAATLVHRLKK